MVIGFQNMISSLAFGDSAEYLGSTSHHLNVQSFSEGLGSAPEGLQGYREVIGVEQAVDGCAAGVHPVSLSHCSD